MYCGATAIVVLFLVETFKQLVIKPIQKNMSKYLINRKPKIMISPLGEKIVVYGALAIALGKEKVK